MSILFRLSHRKERDKRVTTHLFLTARLFNVREIYYSGEKDDILENNIFSVEEKWGKTINKIEYIKNPKLKIKDLKNKGYKIIHLTMYGEDYKKVVKKLREEKLCIIVGSEKVPGWVYDVADYNVAIGNQPHSEITAFTVFMYEIYKCNLKIENIKSKIKIIPSPKGKMVVVNE